MREIKSKGDLKLGLSPSDREHHVGIEIEFCSPTCESCILDKLMESSLKSYVQIKYDGSVYSDSDQNGSAFESVDCPSCGGEGDRGFEMCVLVKQKELSKVMAMVGRYLQSIQAYTNETCGLHVHLDMRNRDPKKAYRNLARIQNVLYKMVPIEREDNEYCLPSLMDDFEEQRSEDRYSGINARAYSKYTTLEVRLHHGTVDVKDIALWSKLLIKAIDCGVISKTAYTSGDLSRQIKLNKTLKQFVTKRIRQYAVGRKWVV